MLVVAGLSALSCVLIVVGCRRCLLYRLQGPDVFGQYMQDILQVSACPLSV